MKGPWRLPDVSEQKVLKTAVCHLFDQFCAEEGAGVVEELPRRPDGTPALIKASFFQRLLGERYELKGLAQSDVSAAQSDLRFLTLLQLLAIRAWNYDFATVSASHSAHNGFLATTDALLLEKLARCALLRGGHRLQDEQQRSDVLRGVGLKIVLAVGAAQALSASGAQLLGSGELPLWLAMRLEGEAWSDCSAVLLRRDDVSLHVLDSVAGRADIWAIVPEGDLVAIFSDKGSVAMHGMPRACSYEVVAFDPRSDDILAELAARSRTPEMKCRVMADELATTLRSRRAAVDAAVAAAEAGAAVAADSSSSSTNDGTPLRQSSEEMEDDGEHGVSGASASTEACSEDFRTPPPGYKNKVIATVQNLESQTPEPTSRQLFPGGAEMIWQQRGWRWQKMRADEVFKQNSELDKVSSIPSSNAARSVRKHGSTVSEEELQRIAALLDGPYSPRSPRDTREASDLCGCCGARSAPSGGYSWFWSSLLVCATRPRSPRQP